MEIEAALVFEEGENFPGYDVIGARLSHVPREGEIFHFYPPEGIPVPEQEEAWACVVESIEWSYHTRTSSLGPVLINLRRTDIHSKPEKRPL